MSEAVRSWLAEAANRFASAPDSALSPPTGAFLMMCLTFLIVRMLLHLVHSIDEWSKENYSTVIGVITGLLFVIYWRDYYSILPILFTLAFHARADEVIDEVYEYFSDENDPPESVTISPEERLAELRRWVIAAVRDPIASTLSIALALLVLL